MNDCLVSQSWGHFFAAMRSLMLIDFGASRLFVTGLVFVVESKSASQLSTALFQPTMPCHRTEI